jgi:2-oxoglutarate ferredoxin oxidoreductase subunit delta
VSTLPQEKFWRTPLDADQIPRTRGIVHVVEERCKGCAYCVDFCPREVLASSDRFNVKGYHPPDVVDAQACTACHLCELICPEFAIGIVETTCMGGSDAR